MLNQMEKRVSQEQVHRINQLHKTQNDVRRKRDKTTEDMRQDIYLAFDEIQRVEAFRRTINNHLEDLPFLESLPRLIQVKVVEIEKEATGLSENCAFLQKKIHCYNNLFSALRGETETMQQ